MKSAFLSRQAWAQVLLAAAMLGGPPRKASAQPPPPSLSDFGYQRLQALHQVQPHRPLLAIAVAFGDTTMSSPDWYYSYIFGATAQSLCVNNWFREVSNGRFDFSGVGVTGLRLTAEEDWHHVGNEGVYYPNVLIQAFAANQWTLCDFDTNNDWTVPENELALLIIGTDDGGCAVSVGPVQQPPNPFPCLFTVWKGTLAKVDYQTTFATFCHELCHTLGTVDLYGSWGRNDRLNDHLTVMGPSDFTACYLDPWHRMQLGWVEPRIASLRSGGITNIPAAQMGDPTAPLLLYDPSRGLNEYWLLEYRTATSPAAALMTPTSPATGW